MAAPTNARLDLTIGLRSLVGRRVTVRRHRPAWKSSPRRRPMQRLVGLTAHIPYHPPKTTRAWVAGRPVVLRDGFLVYCAVGRRVANHPTCPPNCLPSDSRSTTPRQTSTDRNRSSAADGPPPPT